ncbi:MAG: hypothetical protein U0636_11810 [Phycisphaerales bacterium]
MGSASTALTSLGVTGAATLNGASITTTGAQTYQQALSANAALASTASGAVTFNGAVGAVSGRTLTVNTAGSATSAQPSAAWAR